MKLRNINRKFGKTIWAKTGDGEEGGGGGVPTPTDETQPAEAPPSEEGEAPKADDEGSPGEETPLDDKKPSDSEAELLKEVMKKKEALNTLKSQLEETQGKLKSFDGIDPDEVRQMIQDRKAAETKELEKKGEWDRLRERMAQEHQNDMKSVKEQLEEAQKALSDRDGMIEKLTVGHSFDSSKFISEDLTLTPNKARVVYGGHFDIENGKVVGYDKPRGETNRTQIVDGKGDPLPFEDAMKRIVDADPDRDNLIRSKMKSGAGSKTSPDAKAPTDTKELRGLDRINAGLRSGK